MSVFPVRRTGLTAIELLAICGVLALLSGLLVPAVQHVRESARKRQCQDQLHNLAVAMQDYETCHHVLPPGWVQQDRCSANWSWGRSIYPYSTQDPGYDESGAAGNCSLAELADRPESLRWLQRDDGLYRCPSEGDADVNPSRPIITRSGRPVTIRLANYAAVHGVDWTGDSPPDGCFGMNSSVTFERISDGLSNTLLIGERSGRHPRDRYETLPDCGAALVLGVSSSSGRARESDALGIGAGGLNERHDIGNLTWDTGCRAGFSSRHPTGPQFALGDAKVTALSPEMDACVFEDLLQRCDSRPAIVP